MDVGVLLIRVVFGLVMAAHGAQKLFGWFGGYGLTGTGGFFENLGFRPGRVFAALASSAETAGGLLIALGLLGPVGPALMISVMIVAAGAVHWSYGLFAANGLGGQEFNKAEAPRSRTLQPGESLKFVYRVLILSGEPEVRNLNIRYTEFTKDFQ